MNAYLARRDRAVDSASDEDAGTDSEYNDEDAASSNNNDSVTPQRRIRWTAPADKIKDARELFTGDEEAFQTTALLNSLASFILTGYGSDEFSSGLVQYLGVLGIDTQTNRLPVERDEETEEDRDAFLELRKKYLADGSYSPISAMLSLLAYGKHAALNEGNAGNAYWSPDKKTFYLNGRPIVVERFCKMAQSMEAELEESFWQMCWVDDPASRLTVNLAQIQDDMTFTTRGWSFVTAPATACRMGWLGCCRGLEALRAACGCRRQTGSGEARKCASICGS
ncbi:hypothetical protein P3342_007593 [Pyrenophora teres f. teres]|nr:hypothetical protein P3342_007593 [Pyrenophora teres f. teres]